MTARSVRLAALALPVLILSHAVHAAAKPAAKVPAAAAAAPATAGRDALLRALRKELKRSFDKLKDAEKTPLYFLSYEAEDSKSFYIGAMLGAIRETGSWTTPTRSREGTAGAAATTSTASS
ncbi:MAG: hypothetical protein HZB91_06165 [Elusimicrobia bacterium]|nr:hypothetical protein [Elusimicrobiota bacterium]